MFAPWYTQRPATEYRIYVGDTDTAVTLRVELGAYKGYATYTAKGETRNVTRQFVAGMLDVARMLGNRITRERLGEVK